MTSLLAVVGATDPSLIMIGGLPLHPLAQQGLHTQ